MGVFKKTVVWLIAAVSIVMFFFGFFGAETKYGDVSTVIVNGVEQLQMDAGMGQTVRARLAPSSADVIPTADQLEQSKRIVEQRLASFSLPDYSVAVNYDDPSLVLELPYTSDISSIITLAGAKGEFAVRRGTSETDSSVIFGLSNVKSAQVENTASAMFSITSIDLVLDSAAKAALREATREMAEEYAASETSQKLSLWYNGQQLTNLDVTEAITNGRLRFDLIFNLDAQSAAELSVMLNSDDMPLGFTPTTLTEMDLSYENAPRALGIACAAAAAAVAVYLLLRYRLGGVTAVVALLGTAGCMMALQTGFLNPGTRCFSYAALAAFALSLLLAADQMMREYALIRSGLNPSAVARSVSEGMKRSLGLTMRAYCAVFIMAVVLCLFSRGYLLFNLLQPLFSSMGVNSTLLASVGDFGMTLCWGVVFSLVFCVLGNRLMLHSIFSYAGAKKPGLIGGAAHE